MTRDSSLPPGISFRFIGEGQVGAHIRAKDWSKTSIGPMDSWPETLKGYVSMILTLPAPAIIFWSQDQVQIYNDGYAVIMGPRHPKYLGATFQECWPDAYVTIYPWMQRVLQSGEVVQVDRALIPLTRHGFNEEAFFTFSFSPLKDDQGRIAGFLQLVTEMTDTVLVERRLGTLQALALRSASHSLDIRQAVIEPLAANPHDIRFALLFLPEGEQRELTLVESFGIEQTISGNFDPERLSRLVQEAFTSNMPIEIPDVQALIPHVPIEPWPECTRMALALPIRRSDAEHPRGVIVLGASPRLRFDSKYLNFFHGVARDVDGVLAARQEIVARLDIAKQRERLFSVFQQAPVAVCVLEGQNHVFTLANPSYMAFFGGTRDLLGKTMREALPEIEEQGYLELLDNVYQTGEPYLATETAVHVARTDGSFEQRYVNLIYQPKRDADGKVDGIVAAVTDVTEQVLSRKKVEAIAEELEEFAYVASHDLQEPLRKVTLYTQLLLGELKDGDLANLDQYASFIQTGVQRMQALIQDLLAYSRTIHHSEEVDVQVADLNGSLADAMAVLDQKASQLQAVITADKLPAVQADPSQLSLVFQNLISNALKYQPHGQVPRIEITAQSQEEAWVISVQDNGIGFSPEYADKIFGLFKRLYKDEYPGTGLGLAICKRIVERYQGQIWGTSQGEGTGACFHVRLLKAR